MTNYFKGATGSWMWLVIRLYLGYQWFEAGWHKLTGATPFDATGFIKGAIAKGVPASAGAKPVVQAWWADFLQGVALPHAKLFSFMVQSGELLIGLSLMLGFATLFAATMGMLMNFSFLMSGTTSTNPNLLFLEVILVTLGGAYAGYIGVDYWFRPLFRKFLARLFGKGDATITNAA
ncbi:MAG TPA: DoxX family membrane protein [Candidatus Sulfotelmatobacter sp.]|nr:DoxX family membrane protein [Candidatus Sulfotelmatobacter sp.]